MLRKVCQIQDLQIQNLVLDKLKQLVDIYAIRKKLKIGSLKTAHVGYVKRIYHLFNFLSLHLFLFNTFRSRPPETLCWCPPSLREKVLAWFSSSVFTAYFLSAFSIGISIGVFYIYFLSMYVCVDFLTLFLSRIFKCQSALTFRSGIYKSSQMRRYYFTDLM